MKVLDFIKMDVGNTMYQIVDGTVPGYMTSKHIEIEADRNVVSDRYGRCEVFGFEGAGKNKIMLYVGYRVL